MKFNRSTILLVIISLGLTSIIYLTEIKDDGFSLTNTRKEQLSEDIRIFAFDIQDIEIIEIKVNEQIISFIKTEDKNNPWQMAQPKRLVASNAAISFLLNLFIQAQNKLEIPTSVEKINEYGLAKSVKQIELTLNNSDRYQIILGSPNFDNTQIYAQVKFPPSIRDESSIFLVSKSFQYAIERDFDEWEKKE